MGKRQTATESKSATKIDELMERASHALVETRYFEAERLALDALSRARAATDYERMARICLPLLESRRQKRLAAADAGRLVRLDHESEAPALESGCYLLEPLLVAADGRELRDRANADEVPIFVVVREPKTQLGLWPVAMIGPVTVRTRVKPPAADDEPTLEWMQAALEALGDAAIDSIDLNRPAWHRVDQVLERLGTVPEHEKLHQLLAETCKEAALESKDDKGVAEDDALEESQFGEHLDEA